jgi:hypothetical protein
MFKIGTHFVRNSLHRTILVTQQRGANHCVFTAENLIMK